MDDPLGVLGEGALERRACGLLVLGVDRLPGQEARLLASRDVVPEQRDVREPPPVVVVRVGGDDAPDPTDAIRVGVKTGGLVRVSTRIGYYVNTVWVTEGIRPGIVACSHHMGRWKVTGDQYDVNRWQLHDVHIENKGPGKYLFRRDTQVRAFDSADKDSDKVWWSSGGVHQNMTFPVQPDPVSAMHCWHQKVTVEGAKDGDRYGDVYADTALSMKVFHEWQERARPAPGPGGLRRPLHFKRVARPGPDTFKLTE